MITDGKLKLRIMHPTNDYESESKNAHSTAIWLEYDGFKALFAGDIEEDGEKILAKELTNYYNSEIENQDENKIHCNLYKAAHHGSKYSNTEDLLTVLQPRITVISSGKNSYGHPHAETIERLVFSA